MKKSIKITLIVIGTLLIALSILSLITRSDSKLKEVNVYATSEVENVSTTISDISLTGATITIKEPNTAANTSPYTPITATINVTVTNNYSGTISDIKILGKIPFEGNTYTLTNGDLNSKFTTKLKQPLFHNTNLFRTTVIKP